MAFVFFDSKYAPCGFLIVRDGADPYSSDPNDTVLIQSDWDWPGVASRMGLEPCNKCGATDGTVDCEHSKAMGMISRAYDFIADHAGETFEALDDYFISE